MSNKVPEVTIFFWIIKILATTVGETAADYLSTTLHLGLVTTSYIMSGLFIIALIVQLRAQKYVPAVYWAVVVLISIVGTLISDNLVENLGVALKTSSTIFGVALLVVFAIWWLSEKTLSVHSIDTRKRELFYWAAILFTFALGTSAGDLVSEASGLGYPLAALLFVGLIGLTALAYYRLRINGVLAFWIAYILTRPWGVHRRFTLTIVKSRRPRFGHDDYQRGVSRNDYWAGRLLDHKPQRPHLRTRPAIGTRLFGGLPTL